MKQLRWLILLLVPAPLTAGDAVEVPDLRTNRAGADWPRYLGPTLDGKSTETGLVLEWPPEGPPVLWQRKMGQGYSMASVSRGRAFVFDRHGDRARLTCVKSETGDELWQQEYDTDYEDFYGFSNGPRSMPMVDGDRVYTFGVEGRLRAHRVTDGKLLWDVDTAARFGVVQNFFGVASTPVVEGDLLIALVGGSPPGSPGVHSGRVTGNGSGIVAFDKRTGEVRYQVTDELASYSSPVVATIGGRRLGLVFARGGLVGFRPESGTVDFHFPWRASRVQTVNASTPVVSGNRVFLSESYEPGSVLLELGAKGPTVVWKDPPRDKSLKLHWMTPILHEGTLYGSSGSGSGDAELRAVQLEGGKVLWKEPGLGRSTLLYVDGHLIVLGEYGDLLAVQATPGGFQPVSRSLLRGPGGPLIRHPAWSPPIVSHGLLYVRGADRLVCLSLLPERGKSAE